MLTFFRFAALLTLFFVPIAAEARIEIEAAADAPFGVGRIIFEPPQGMLPEPLGMEGIGLTEKNNRIFYPAVDNPAFGKLVKEILEGDTPLTTGGPVRREVGGILRGILDRPPRATIYFLFRGDDPLDISLDAQTPIHLTVVPQRNPTMAKRLLQLWWRQYAKTPGILRQKPDYPPIVDAFLTATLARRLGLRLPGEKQTPSAYAVLEKEVGLNLATESLRAAMMQDRILGLCALTEPADQPLPPVETPEFEPFDFDVDAKIEPIAQHVPASCFYVRFGSFANFLWLQDTLAKWGGDAQNLIALRGLDRGMSARMERQLVTKQTALSRMLGATVVADVAIIGADMFFREGAAYGLLFQARNSFALSTSFNQQRSERVAQGGVKEEKIKIGDRQVSYISSPDGSVRSYYAVSGDFHLLTTSRNIVEMFLASSAEKNSLGASKGFRHARTAMPLDRDDTVFVYLSDEFFRNLTSFPHRAEMTRRLQATADIELVQLARLAAAAEGFPSDSIEQLKAAGLVPANLGPLPDGSRVVLEGGNVYDTLRGRRGAFLPIGDAPVAKASRAELAEYAKFAEFYRKNWGRMDPLMAGIKRTALENNRDRVVVDVMMSPFAPQHFSKMKEWLGPPDSRQLAPLQDDMAAIELALNNQHVFAGIRDVGRPSNFGMASFLPAGRLRDFVIGYIGTTGELGVLNFLNIGIPPRSDPNGYAMSPLGGWRRQFGQFTVFSFQREVLEDVAPRLRFENARRPAQIRLRVEDLSHAGITPKLNDLGYARTRETSLGNLRLLHALSQQLHVPGADCREKAEFLLDAKLHCPLGGEYVFRNNVKGPAYWTSTAMTGEQKTGGGLLGGVHAPEGYSSPPLSWFRGLNLDAVMTEKNITGHAEIIMEHTSRGLK